MRDLKFGKNQDPRFYMGTPCMETGRQTEKLPFGESPFQNTIHAHLGINIYIVLHDGDDNNNGNKNEKC